MFARKSRSVDGYSDFKRDLLNMVQGARKSKFYSDDSRASQTMQLPKFHVPLMEEICKAPGLGLRRSTLLRAAVPCYIEAGKTPAVAYKKMPRSDRIDDSYREIYTGLNRL